MVGYRITRISILSEMLQVIKQSCDRWILLNLVICMIKDRIGLHVVVLPIYHNRNII